MRFRLNLLVCIVIVLRDIVQFVDVPGRSAEGVNDSRLGRKV